MSNYFLNYNDVYEDYLAHYGVLGMKWGVHRSSSYYDNKISNTTKKRDALQAKYDSTKEKRKKKAGDYLRMSNKNTAKMRYYGGKAEQSTSPIFSSRERLRKKAARYEKMSGKYQIKAHRILDNIRKDETRISKLDKRIVDLGNKRIKALMEEQK